VLRKFDEFGRFFSGCNTGQIQLGMLIKFCSAGVYFLVIICKDYIPGSRQSVVRQVSFSYLKLCLLTVLRSDVLV
jgi:hypothetical protein